MGTLPSDMLLAITHAVSWMHTVGWLTGALAAHMWLLCSDQQFERLFCVSPTSLFQALA